MNNKEGSKHAIIQFRHLCSLSNNNQQIKRGRSLSPYGNCLMQSQIYIIVQLNDFTKQHENFEPDNRPNAHSIYYKYAVSLSIRVRI